MSLSLSRISLQTGGDEINKIWTGSMKDRFYHIYRTYIKAGKDRELYMDRLKIEFPELTRKQIDDYDRIVMSREATRKRRKALYRDWNREKLDLKGKLQSQVKQQIAQSLAATQKEMERAQLNQELIRIRKEFEERKVLFDKKQRDIEEKKRMEKLKQEELAKMKEEQYLEHTKKVKAAATAYTEERAASAMATRQLQDEQVRRFKEQQKKIIEKNKPKVYQRQDQEIQKIFHKIEKKEVLAKQKEDEAKRIEDAIQGYSIRPQVPRDAERLVAATESLQNRKTTILDKADKVNMFKVHGFNVKELMGDMRYRIATALHEAGIGRGDYANSLLNNLSGAPRPAPFQQ
eukprot:TRINITY_DN2466_c0_g2_i1.p1 TRINITY_DN2466_c0_g2~~TRINITY_DN2466_c0_g2_i1.p1  ORF type:complete len:347 (+),score=97.60 TRINITY_DN2466_c0_g2_i1:467-1507(+)